MIVFSCYYLTFIQAIVLSNMIEMSQTKKVKNVTSSMCIG